MPLTVAPRFSPTPVHRPLKGLCGGLDSRPAPLWRIHFAIIPWKIGNYKIKNWRIGELGKEIMVEFILFLNNSQD